MENYLEFITLQIYTIISNIVEIFNLSMEKMKKIDTGFDGGFISNNDLYNV